MTYSKIIVVGVALLSVTGCSSAIDRLSKVGKPPQFSDFKDPTTKPEYQPISWPLPQEETQPKKYANSLWQQGSRTFFRDQRASRAGDILKVVMKIKDKGKLEDSTDRTRTANEAAGLTAAYGLENKLFHALPGTANPAALLGLTGNTNTKGDGKIERKEEIETQLAATVTQVLPNGNLVIDGKQEIRINNEIREIGVQGVVRPQDIASNNTIDYSQIAEARITYGGRGQVSDIQGPRWGHQVIEAISPF